MFRLLSRRVVVVLVGIGLASGFLTLSTVPAQAASFAVSVTASATTVTVGGKVTLSGVVSPRPSSRKVYLQRRYAGSSGWTTVKKFSAAATGKYTVTVTAENDRDRAYRIYKPKTSSRKAGSSRILKVVVTPAAVTAPAGPTSISPGTQPLSGGRAVTITGTNLAGTTSVTVTPQVKASYTRDGTGVLAELQATFSQIDAQTLVVTPPASLGGTNLVKVYTANGTLTGTLRYARSASTPTSFEKQVLAEVNARRSTRQVCQGKSMPAVGTIAWDGELTDLARSHARDLATRFDGAYAGTLSHVTFGLKSFDNRLDAAGFTTGSYGEDLAFASNTHTPAQIVTMWMGSTAGHCESVMRAGWKTAGVGVADGTGAHAAQIFTTLNLHK